MQWYLGERGYGLPGTVPAVRTPEPRDVPGAVFDPGRVDRAIAGLRCLRHTQGKWAGRPLEPDGWQVAWIVAPVFGWVAPVDDDDGGPVVLARIIRDCYVELPRKNGKTTIGAGLLMVLAFADGEPGAQALAVAGSKDQAKNAFRPAKMLAEQSPQLRAAGVKPLTDIIERPADGSFLKVASSRGDLIHGTNIHGALVDELHVHKSGDLLEAVETGTGARAQPLVIKITTADDGKPNTVYAQQRTMVERLASGSLSNPTVYGVVFAADKDDDPFAEATIARANPGYPVSPTRGFMAAAVAKAKGDPVALASYKRLHLGIRTKQVTRYIDLPEWDRTAGLIDELELRGEPAYGGVDLGNVADITAWAWVFPDAGTGGYDVLWRFWLPEAQVDHLDQRTAGAMSSWVDLGLVEVTPGATTDYDFVVAQARRDRDLFDVVEVAFDPWNANQLTKQLQDDKAPLVQVRQGFQSLSPPLKEIKRLVAASKPDRPLLRHAGNPVMRWMTDNLVVTTDAAGNVKPDKAKASDKIDGWSALVTAMARAMHHAPRQRSAYEDNDLMRV